MASTVLRLPQRDKIAVVDPAAEPTRYYYWPVVGWFYRKRLQMILDALNGQKYENILEVAYGSGIFLPSLSELTDRLHGVDLHEKIDTVRETLGHAGVDAELRVGDARRLPYDDDSFACVVNISMLEHLEDPGSAIDEMLRVLRPGGTLVLGFPCRNLLMDTFFRALGFNPRKIHPSSHRDILEALEKRRAIDRRDILPSFVPMDWALYMATRSVK